MKTTLIDNDLTLAVEDAIPASPVYAPEEILALAVCASPNGSRDAGDLALLHAARERGITLPYAQQENSWEAPSRERPYSTAVLKAADKADASPFHGSPRQPGRRWKNCAKSAPWKRSA